LGRRRCDELTSYLPPHPQNPNRQIDNPEYKPDPKLHARAKDVSFVGFELWQVKAGTHFDDIIITDSIEVRWLGVSRGCGCVGMQA
jgi:hypothetical protein